MTTQAAQFVGSIPEHYDSGLGPHLFVGYAEDIARRVARLGPAPGPESVLELAAGTGIVTRQLRDLLPSHCDLLASDLNGPMLEIAKTKFGPDERVGFEEADAMDLGHGAATFDSVVCQFGVMFFPDKARSYAEVHRVLKPGGSYVFNVWDSRDKNPFAQIAHEVVAEFFPENPPGFYKVPFGYHDADDIRQSLLRAGFAEVAVDRIALRSSISSSADLAKGLVFGNPLYEEIIARGGNPKKICHVVAEAIGDKLGSDMPLQALVIVASKA